VRTASSIERVVDRTFDTVDPDTRIADVRKKFSVTNHAVMVTNDDGVLIGILTKSDIFKPVRTRLVLVDHNELTQAVPGADEVTIAEIIDHHRLGAMNTAQPILFINEPVGSTCTIVADLFRREGIHPSPSIAGIMMAGLISDTLHLNGPTTTGKDAILLAWLSEIAGVNSKQLADEIFNSGSVILANPPEKVVRSDFKIYEEAGLRFAVSPVAELGFGNFRQPAKPTAEAVEGHAASALTLRTGIRFGGRYVVARVRDNGPGVPLELRSKIFRSFFTTKDAGKGTGLGLSISRGIVQDHGGRLGVSSSHRGGAVFHIILPVPGMGAEREKEKAA